MALLPEFFEGVTGFEWDTGNAEKIQARHDVSPAECEQVFLNRPVLVAGDVRHSGGEARYFAWGITDQARRLAVAFTVRGPRVRVISARPMSRGERRWYAAAAEAREAAQGSSDVPD